MIETIDIYKLENWAVVSTEDNPYLAPELRVPRLTGKVFGHPRFDDGKDVVTSRIAGLHNETVVKTQSGSFYELGTIDPVFEKLYPGAKEQLIKALKLIEVIKDAV